MANTTTITGHMVSIKLDGSTDWNVAADMADYVSTGLRVQSIFFDPALGGAQIAIENSPSIGGGAFIARFQAAATTDQRVKYFDPPKQMWPFIDVSDGQSLASSFVILTLE